MLSPYATCFDALHIQLTSLPLMTLLRTAMTPWQPGPRCSTRRTARRHAARRTTRTEAGRPPRGWWSVEMAADSPVQVGWGKQQVDRDVCQTKRPGPAWMLRRARSSTAELARPLSLHTPPLPSAPSHEPSNLSSSTATTHQLDHAPRGSVEEGGLVISGRVGPAPQTALVRGEVRRGGRGEEHRVGAGRMQSQGRGGRQTGKGEETRSASRYGGRAQVRL